MAADSKSHLPCINRRSVLRSSAACVMFAAVSNGCTSSEPISAGGDGTAGAGGETGAAGMTGDAGATGQRRDAGQAAGSGGGASGSNDAGSGGANVNDAGMADASGAAGAGGAGGHLGTDGGNGGVGGAPGQCPGSVAAGKASAISVGSLVLVGNGLVVGRDAAGLYAMSSICTHQGCGTNVVGSAPQQSLYCPCHGSAFSGTGAVTRGPARRALQHYLLESSPNGDLTVCAGSAVASTVRTAG
jgi:Rieske Fe-S protein